MSFSNLNYLIILALFPIFLKVAVLGPAAIQQNADVLKLEVGASRSVLLEVQNRPHYKRHGMLVLINIELCNS